MTNKVEKENVQIKYCSTGEMWGDFATNPTQGAKIRNLKTYVLDGNK